MPTALRPESRAPVRRGSADRRDPRLQDRSRPVATVCDLGTMAALAVKTLKDLGFTNVAYLEGGTQARKDAGLPTQTPADA